MDDRRPVGRSGEDNGQRAIRWGAEEKGREGGDDFQGSDGISLSRNQTAFSQQDILCPGWSIQIRH